MRKHWIIWGYITGRIGVRCADCTHLVNGTCHGSEIAENDQYKQRTCGKWKKKYSWIKRNSPTQEENIKLKNHDQ